MENRELITFFGGLFIAIALIIALFIWYINTSNSKAARWGKYLFRDKWIKQLIIAWFVGALISFIPCIGEVLGSLLITANCRLSAPRQRLPLHAPGLYHHSLL